MTFYKFHLLPHLTGAAVTTAAPVHVHIIAFFIIPGKELISLRNGC